MKASLNFRDDQKPLLKAKLPLNVLNFPFRSGIVAGHSKELSLQLSTFFDAGPSFKLAYNPNNGSNPFNLVVKTGTGKYGSPINSSMVISTEFNLVGNCGTGNPSFMVHFKPKFGDFGIRKNQSSSVFVNIKNVDDSVIKKPKMSQGYSPESFEFPTMKKMATLAKDVKMNASTSLPILNFANVKFHWSLRFPTEIKNMLNRPTAMSWSSFKNIPILVMNKISIEHVIGGDDQQIGRRDSVMSLMTSDGAGKDDVQMMCLRMSHQLDTLREENGMLRKAVDDLRSRFSGSSLSVFRSDEETEVCKQMSSVKDNVLPR